MLSDHHLKKLSCNNFNSSSSSMYILLNNINIFLPNVFKWKLTFILMGCRERLYSFVCIWYDANVSFTQIKW